MISIFFQILGLQPRISKVSRTLEHFFLTVGQNNFDNKIQFQQLAKRKKRAIITIEEPNVSLVYASENVKVSIIENEEEESSKTGM